MSQEIYPHQAAAPGSGEILNRDSEPGPGNNSTLDNLFLPRSLGPIVNSDRTVHNPPPQPINGLGRYP